MGRHSSPRSIASPRQSSQGVTLEEHLRKLCDQHGIATTKSDGKFHKADTLNAELAKAGACNVSEQKQVTAWLGIRNSAAHGRPDEFTDDQVKLMIQGIRDFTVRNPA
jgi:hypothetical protein